MIDVHSYTDDGQIKEVSLNDEGRAFCQWMEAQGWPDRPDPMQAFLAGWAARGEHDSQPSET